MKQMPFENYLIVSDLDGTLLDNNYRVSKENLDALNRFVEAGGRFTVATGRNERSLEPYIGELPVNAPVILYNGALIYDAIGKKRLWCDFIDHGVETVVAEVLRLFPGTGIEIYCEGESCLLSSNAITERHARRLGSTPRAVHLSEIPKPWYKVMLFDEHERLELVEKYLNKESRCFRAVYSEPQLLELLGIATSKGSALKQLTAMLGVDMGKVIAIGDNLNDFEMIRSAGIGVAVGNAVEVLKRSADYCTCSNDDHALMDLIRWLDLSVL